MTAHLIRGDARMLPLATGSVQCVVCSPPFYGLRAYGTKPVIWGGDPDCPHVLADGPSAKPLTGGSGAASAKQVTNAGSQYGNAWASETSALEQGNKRKPSDDGIDGRNRATDKAAPQAIIRTTSTCTRCGAWRGELGSEPTPALFVAHLVEVMRECKRVLRDDGCVFLNMGDSYSGSGKGPTGKNGIGDQSARQGFVGSGRASAYGNRGKGRSGSRGPDSSCSGLCDGCRAASFSRTPDTDQPVSFASSPPEQKGRGNGLLDSFSGVAGVVPPGVLASTTPESSLPPQAACSHCGNCGACLSVLASSSRDSRACVRKTAGQSSYRSTSAEMQDQNGSISGNGATDGASGSRTLDRAADSYSWEYSNTPTHHIPTRPKSLLLVPERLAIALSDDGWIVRSRIAWCKAAPMPESVKDRPTSAWEHVWMLTKSGRYFWNTQAAREEARYGRREHTSGWKPWGHQQDGERTNGSVTGSDPSAGRNLWNYWLLSPDSYSGAHFATYPRELVRKCVEAASREGDVVLDPFSGSGTTCFVAASLGRVGIGVELSAEYIAQARYGRLVQDFLPLAHTIEAEQARVEERPRDLFATVGVEVGA